MKKDELQDILKKARVPEISVESREEFSRAVARRLNSRNSGETTTSRPSLRWAWALAFATCIVILAPIAVRRQTPHAIRTNETSDCLASSELIQQTIALFPNRVRAIVDDGHGLKLVLSENADVPTSSPIYVRICDGLSCSSLVTFSGQEIQVGGRNLTVLADPRGEIILVGDHFVWSSAKPVYADNRLKIDAKNIGPAVL